MDHKRSWDTVRQNNLLARWIQSEDRHCSTLPTKLLQRQLLTSRFLHRYPPESGRSNQSSFLSGEFSIEIENQLLIRLRSFPPKNFAEHTLPLPTSAEPNWP